MSLIDDLLAANSAYVDGAAHSLGDGRPRRRLGVVTCMDTRIDVLAVLGLELGQAVVIRNAGARVTEDVLRSLALATHVLGVDTVVVMQHTNCGLAGVSDEALKERTGADLDFLAIDDHAAALHHDIGVLRAAPFLAQLTDIAGFVYDVSTGAIEDVARA